MVDETVSDLDKLEWRSWPKTPRFEYVDLCEDVRLERDRTKGVRMYGVRVDYGERGVMVVRGLTASDVMEKLAEIHQTIPILPLVPGKPYDQRTNC